MSGTVESKNRRDQMFILGFGMYVINYNASVLVENDNPGVNSILSRSRRRMEADYVQSASYSENRIEIDGLCGGSFISAPGKSHSSSFNLVQRVNRLVVEPIASSRFAGRLEADLVTKSDDALCKPFGQPLWIASVKVIRA